MNNRRKYTPRDLQNRWERAVERAVEDAQDRSELTAHMLNNAAGLHVESGVRGGAWSNNSCTCAYTCQQCPSDLC